MEKIESASYILAKRRDAAASTVMMRYACSPSLNQSCLQVSVWTIIPKLAYLASLRWRLVLLSGFSRAPSSLSNRRTVS
ncbi:MAG: hypothetical protein LBR80_10955 [Deltaproteobacteria bacterium]|nr:hypothetical protein [Deltaproteobacteria bacterium]